MVKIVLFDHDDTLVGTIKAKWAQHKFIAQKFYNITLSDETIQKHWGKPFTTLIKALYETDDIQQAMAHNIETRPDFPKTLFPYTISTLQALLNQGIVLGLITATTLSSLENDFRTLPLPDDLFEYIQTEEETAFHKPNPKVFDPVKLWLKEKGHSPKDVVYVGDGLHDFHAATGAGFQFIGVETGLVSREEFEKVGAKSIPSLQGLLELDVKVAQ